MGLCYLVNGYSSISSSSLSVFHEAAPTSYNSQSESISSLSGRSGRLEQTLSIISKQLCWASGFIVTLRSRIAGFKIVMVCEVILGLSDEMA